MGSAQPAARPRTAPGFDDVYAAEFVRVARLAYLLVRSRAVAEELAQDAFLRLYGHFDAVENPAAFLRTAVGRLALTWLGRADMERDRLTRVGGGQLAAVEAPELDETWLALGRLPVERRTVLVLRFYAQMRSPEIAELLGCSAATVRSRVRRGLTDLRKELDL
jgi:RNA polymerase sigma factor (sigma-70 family)